MFTSTVRRALLAIPIVLLAATSARAQDSNDWARKMFDSVEHDFGVVAKGAEVVHRFKVTNLYKEDVQIQSVTTTCGCTAPRFDQAPVKSLDFTYIEISMDTNKFQREKTSSINVTFNQPQFAIVTIPVKVYIRTDVVLNPGGVNFGAVDQGSAPERKVDIAYAFAPGFAGRADWKIQDVVTNNKHLKAKVVERGRGNGNVSYELIVSLLPDAPPGMLRQQIALITDDENSPQIPVLVQARVEADVTITPVVIQIGSVNSGVEYTYNVVLKGKKPFVIEKVECDSPRKAFKMPELKSQSNIVHVLPLSFTAPKEAGSFAEKFTVTIAGRPEPLVFTARGTIVQTAQK